MSAPSRPSAARWRRSEAVGFGGKPPLQRPSMQLLAGKSPVKNSLRVFADVELPNGLRICEIPVLSSAGKDWAALPSKPQIDKDDRQKIGVSGKPAYSPILEWRSRELADGFSAKIVALVLERYPDALSGGDGR